MPEKKLIEAVDLCKYYKTPKGALHAVEGVNFTIEEGTTLGVVGESGCGKSTLGRTIMNLHDSTSGKILFDGEDVTHPNKAMNICRRITGEEIPFLDLNGKGGFFKKLSSLFKSDKKN